ncbi:hypothetical protein D3C78_1480450 [compost metagenome]
MQLVVGALPLQLVDLGQERGDADAAGDQHVPAGTGVEGEQVVRGGNGQRAADPHLLVHERRAALGLLFQTHADLVLAGVGRVAQQRVGVAETPAVGALHLHDDVAAAGEGRQRLPVLAHQGEALDQRGDLFDPGHPGGDHFVVVGHGEPRLRQGAAVAAAR